MNLGRSKLTAEGRISVPPEVRTRLGVGPGSLLEWAQDGDQIVVRSASPRTFEGLHRAVFPDGLPARRPLAALTDGIQHHVRERHMRKRR